MAKNDTQETPEVEDANAKTWIEKLDKSEPLNKWDETKADADWLFNKRQRDEQERQEFEARKAGAFQGHPDVNRSNEE